MTNPSADPVPAITEADATGDTAALYADIRATLGVPVVNLIWRHLATMPDALPWAWTSLKPLYESGAIAAEADALRSSIDLPTDIAASIELSQSTLTAAGISEPELARITMVLRSYDRSNTLNIIAVNTLGASLQGRSGNTERSPITTSGRPPETITGEMPIVLSLSDMPPNTRSLVETLNTFGARTDILPTMYRHLAHWPAFLALIHVLLAPHHANGRLETLIQSISADSHFRAAQLSGALATPLADFDTFTKAKVQHALTSFAEGPLAKMMAITTLIRSAMPNKQGSIAQ